MSEAPNLLPVVTSESVKVAAATYRIESFGLDPEDLGTLATNLRITPPEDIRRGVMLNPGEIPHTDKTLSLPPEGYYRGLHTLQEGDLVIELPAAGNFNDLALAHACARALYKAGLARRRSRSTRVGGALMLAGGGMGIPGALTGNAWLQDFGLGLFASGLIVAAVGNNRNPSVRDVNHDDPVPIRRIREDGTIY